MVEAIEAEYHIEPQAEHRRPPKLIEVMQAMDVGIVDIDAAWMRLQAENPEQAYRDTIATYLKVPGGFDLTYEKYDTTIS